MDGIERIEPGEFFQNSPDGSEIQTERSNNMKSLIKSLAVLAIGGGIFAGSAVAGPGDAHPSFAYQPFKKAEPVQIALFRAPAGNATKVEVKQLPNPNPKIQSVRTVQVTGRMSPRY